MTMKKNIFMYIVAALFVTSCGTKEVKENKEVTESISNTVELTDKQLKQLDITKGTLIYASFHGNVEASGRLLTSPQGEASVAPKIGATVQRILVREGQEVSKGQILAYLSHPDLIDIQSRYLTAVNRRDYLYKEYIRQSKMMNERVGVGKDFDRTKSELKIANSEISMLSTQMQQLGISPSAVRKGKAFTNIAVKSPIAGTVEQINVEIGQYATPETAMIRIVNTQTIFAELQIYQRDIPKLQKNQQVILQTQTDGGQVYSGKVFSIGSTFDSNTQAVPVRVNIYGKKDALISGLYVKARIATKTTKMKAVPTEAIVDDAGKSYIFTATKVKGNWKFSPLAVRKIKEENGMVAVQPVQANAKIDIVALSGAYYLLSDMKKGETGED